MANTVFREKVEDSGKPEVLPKGKTPDRSGDEGERIEVPYLDYEGQSGHPFPIDYFDLGSYWKEKMGSFEEEVEIIEDYFRSKIRTGQIANNVDTIRSELKKMEKLTGLKDEKRPIMRIETIVAHIKFLNETDEIKDNLNKYGNYKSTR